MEPATKKLTVAAVCTALAVIMCVMTAYLPLSFMPLYVAAFCIFLACKRGNLVYGLLCATASVGLMFLMTGLSIKWLLFVLVFAPYGVLAYFMHPFGYTKVRHVVLRVPIMAAYFNLMLGMVYLIAVNVLSVGIEGLDLLEWSAKLGGYAVLAVVATVVLLPLDFIFSMMSLVVLKKLPTPVKRLPPPVSAVNAQPEKPEPQEQSAPQEEQGAREEKRVDDVFGYEIFDDDGDKNDG